MTTVLDEISVIGGVSGIALGFVMATWYDVYPDIAFRGMLFAGMTIAGLVLLLFSRPVFAFLIGNWRQLLLTCGFIAAGVIATAAVQFVLLAYAPAPVLSAMPPDVQLVYLAEAAISETYFYFGLAAFFMHYLHPVVGVPIPPALSYFMHQFVYGAMPVYVWVVVASFAVQSLLFLLTRRLSVPLGIHGVWNLV